MKTKMTIQPRMVGLLVTVMFAAVLFLSGCGSGAESQEFSAFLSRPLAEVSLGELLFCVFCVCLITR